MYFVDRLIVGLLIPDSVEIGTEVALSTAMLPVRQMILILTGVVAYKISFEILLKFYSSVGVQTKGGEH
jgi:hypothetical protein